MANTAPCRVVILGGGFGGVFAARALRRHGGDDIRVELISRNNFFVFQPLLPEVASGEVHAADAVVPLRLFLPGVSVRVADVHKIDPTAKAGALH
ncbi:MAG: FAD-dependent oxidoreductase [Rhodospirillales bacterium]|nr:FAD-dependent oxidoreductase [Rhodospirillales bacterium]